MWHSFNVVFNFGLQLFIDPAKLLPLNRFLPKPPQPKGPKKKGPPGGVGNQRGGFGGRGGFSRGRGGTHMLNFLLQLSFKIGLFITGII